LTLWDKDILLGGERLTDTFGKTERFVIWDMAMISEKVPMPSGDLSQKTELVVSPTLDPAGAKRVGTLSTPIARKAVENLRDGDGNPTDTEAFPALVYWDEVETDFPQNAVVLKFDRLLKDDYGDELPAAKHAAREQAGPFSLEPVTAEQAPF
jgi:hypothetical protein